VLRPPGPEFLPSGCQRFHFMPRFVRFLPGEPLLCVPSVAPWWPAAAVPVSLAVDVCSPPAAAAWCSSVMHMMVLVHRGRAALVVMTPPPPSITPNSPNLVHHKWVSASFIEKKRK